MQQPRSSGGVTAAALAVVGGVVAVAGSLLSWAKASVGPSSFSAKGIDGWEGKVTIVAGVVMLVVGASALVGAEGARARLRVSAIAGGVAAAGVGIYTALTATDQIVDSAASEIASELGVPVEQARSTVQAAVDHGLLQLSLQVGLYLVIAGGVLGIVAGILAIVTREPVPPMPAQPLSDSGLTGWAAPLPPKPADAPLTASVWAVPSEAPAVETGEGAPAAGVVHRDEGEEPSAP
jgi:hypothetical protein